MKTYRETLVLSILILVLCVSGCGPTTASPSSAAAAADPLLDPNQPSELKPNLQAGQRYLLNVQLVSKALIGFLRFAGPSGEMKDTGDMILDCRVVDVADDGTARIELTIKSLKCSMTSLGVKASFDSAGENKGGNDKQKRYRRVFQGLVGSKYSALVDSRGRVVKLLNMAEKVKQASNRNVTGPLGGDYLSLLLAETNLRDYASPPFFANLPTGPTAKGDTWIDQQTVVAPQASAVQAEQKYELKSYRMRENEKIAEISYRGILLEEETAAAGPGGKGKKGKGGLEIIQAGTPGKILYSVTEGRLIKLDEMQRAEIRTLSGSGRRTSKPKKDGKNRMFYDIKRIIEFQEHNE